MSVAEIKSNIINEISSLEDVLILEKITKILGIGIPKKENYVFSEEQRKRIEKALKQAENGECISDEEAEKEIQAWLEK
jgi:hypothetical protein